MIISKKGRMPMPRSGICVRDVGSHFDLGLYQLVCSSHWTGTWESQGWQERILARVKKIVEITVCDEPGSATSEQNGFEFSSVQFISSKTEGLDSSIRLNPANLASYWIFCPIFERDWSLREFGLLALKIVQKRSLHAKFPVHILKRA